MLTSGDYVTARVDGISYLEKPPLVYWLMAGSFKIFGVHDWAARLPIALFCVGLPLLTAAFGIWAFGRRVGFYAGLVMATCVGLFLFTRVVIPDVILTFTIMLAMWALLRVTDEGERHPGWWAFMLAAGIGTGLLLKSLIAVVFPVGAGLIYLFLTKQLFLPKTWKRIRPFSGLAVILLIAVPWHVLATLRNPPYWSWSMHSGPGEYHGFLWFFFINEQLLRFLNLRYPRDYNTVPVVLFWLFHLAWLFPWSVYFPAIAKLSFRPIDRAGRTRLLALCWIGVVLGFFTFSTTQEYYSMPIYPAMALLLGCAINDEGKWIRRGTAVLTAIAAVAAAVCIGILIYDRNVATPGDIFNALTSHPSAYTLSLGHMEDLTLQSFAYLRTPLLLAAIALVIGAAGTFRAGAKRGFLFATVMMLLFFQAARIAMVTFDPYFSSRPLANAILRSPEGKLIVDKHYYAYSSVFFYTNRTALLLNGRILNLSYGSYAPGAPDVFIDDAQLKQLWSQPQRYYLVAGHVALPRLEGVLGRENMNVVAESGGKYVFTNSPLPGSRLLPSDAIANIKLVPQVRPSVGLTRAQVSVQRTDANPSASSGQALGRQHRNDAAVPAENRPHHGMRWYNTEFPRQSSGLTATAFRHQTRYILSSRDFLGSNRADRDPDSHSARRLRQMGFRAGSPSDRLAWPLDLRHLLPVGDVVAPACGTSKRGNSSTDASLHCTSPEEDA